MGLIFSLSSVILAFSWIKYEPNIDLDLFIDYSCELDRVIYYNLPPPPPPLPMKIKIVSNEAITETVEFNENSVISFYEENHSDNQTIPFPPPPVDTEETANFN